LGIFVVQIAIAALLRDAPWWLILILAYVVSGTLNHTLNLGNHELSHNLCFGPNQYGHNYNEWLAVFSNLATGVPSAMSFKRFHRDHHKHQGEEGIDVDLATDVERLFFTNAPLKALWVFLHPYFYAFRPMILMGFAHKPSSRELLNYVIGVVFDIFIYKTLGGKSLFYLVGGTILGFGLHPVAAHAIAEHHEFIQGHETYSYYGILNYVNFNVGYHNEHHDFPNIPWSKLPEVRKIAPEFYNHLPHHTSYLRVLWDYIMNPAMGPHSRVKRRVEKQI